MRISDWSSDVCSSDLPVDPHDVGLGVHPVHGLGDVVDPLEHVGDLVDAIDEDEGPDLRELPGDRVDEVQRETGEGSHGAGDVGDDEDLGLGRSEEHTSELQSLMRISYAVFCLKKKIDEKQAC